MTTDFSCNVCTFYHRGIEGEREVLIQDFSTLISTVDMLSSLITLRRCLWVIEILIRVWKPTGSPRCVTIGWHLLLSGSGQKPDSRTCWSEACFTTRSTWPHFLHFHRTITTSTSTTCFCIPTFNDYFHFLGMLSFHLLRLDLWSQVSCLVMTTVTFLSTCE